jgi:hypothetical protein
MFYLKTQNVPRSKNFSISVIKPIIFLLYGAHVAVCPELNTKHINTVWAEFKILKC